VQVAGHDILELDLRVRQEAPARLQANPHFGARHEPAYIRGAQRQHRLDVAPQLGSNPSLVQLPHGDECNIIGGHPYVNLPDAPSQMRSPSDYNCQSHKTLSILM
jgi:hypothetical protein